MDENEELSCPNCGSKDKIGLIDYEPLFIARDASRELRPGRLLEYQVYATVKCFNCNCVWHPVAELKWRTK